MTDEQLQRIHDIEYSCDSREELAERIVGLEDELAQWERLTAGVELPEYPITQFKPKDLERENAKLREQIERLQPKDCEGNALDIADTVNMLRSEYDGDHEWDDVVVELALTKWGGDRWIVRGSKGEAWACDCLKTGYDEDAYEGSDDAEPIVNPSLIEAENAKLRELVDQMYRDMQGVLDMSTDTVFVDSIGTLRDKMDWYMQAMAELGMPPADYEQRMRELGLRGEDA